MMPKVSELSSLLFNNFSNVSGETKIIYGTALSDSEDGEVLVALDEAIYALGDDESDYQWVNLEISNDVGSIDEDEDASTDLVYYEEV